MNNTLHFGMRGRQENADMLFGDVTLKCTSDGLQYIEYNERLTQTRKGNGGSRSFAPKMFACPGNPRCPVIAFKEFIRRRPDDTLTPDSRFYLGLLRNVKPDSDGVKNCWFSRQPLGKNTLGNIAKTMSEKGELSGRKVNHSIRKTTVTSLLHSKVEATTVMQLTGHRNVASVNEYSSASLQQQQEMSSILSNIGSGGGNANKPETNIQTVQNHVPNTNAQTPNISNDVIYEPVIEFAADEMGDNALRDIALDAVVSTIKEIEKSPKNNDINIMPSKGLGSHIAILPHASIGNVTINIYNSDK